MELDRLLAELRRTPATRPAVDGWSLYVTESRQIGLGIKDRQTGNAHAPLNLTHAGGVRYLLVWNDGRVSRGFWERRQVEVDAEQALADARGAAYQDPDAAQVPGPATFPEVETHDAATARLARGEVGILTSRLDTLRDLMSGDPVQTWSGSFGASEGRARLLTSTGLQAETWGTSLGWHVTVNGELGDGFRARRAESAAAFRERVSRLVELSRELTREAAPRPGRVQPVILHPRVVESFVLHTVLANLDGGAVARGESRFHREQFGSAEPVLHTSLRLAVDPLQPFRSGSFRFTTEGVAAGRCTYVEDGRLVTPVLDRKYARRLKLAPTPPPSAPDVVIFEGPAPLSLEQARRAAAGGALILSVLGVHTQDVVSGDFSLSAPQALRLDERGEIAGRLRATLSGNLFDVLRSDGLAWVRFDAEHLPGLLFDCHLDPK